MPKKQELTKKQEILNAYAECLIIPDMSDVSPEDKPFIREFINIKRKKTGQTYEDISEATDVPVSTIGRILNSKAVDTGCNIYTAGAIAKAVGVSLDAYYGIGPQQIIDSHENEKLRLEIKYLKEKNDDLSKDKHTILYILFIVSIIALMLVVDILVPTIGITSGSYTIEAACIIIAVILIVSLLINRGRRAKN